MDVKIADMTQMTVTAKVWSCGGKVAQTIGGDLMRIQTETFKRLTLDLDIDEVRTLFAAVSQLYWESALSLEDDERALVRRFLDAFGADAGPKRETKPLQPATGTPEAWLDGLTTREYLKKMGGDLDRDPYTPEDN